jgi:hypothetical protein
MAWMVAAVRWVMGAWRVRLLLRRSRGRVPWVREVATLTVRRASAGTGRGQQEQPSPAANRHGRGGQAATLREWAELIPVPRPAIAMSGSTSRAGTGRENRP